jgi:hypothetical protein
MVWLKALNRAKINIILLISRITRNSSSLINHALINQRKLQIINV